MAFSFSKLLNSKKKKSINIPRPKMDVEGPLKYAENDENDVYISLEELGGFHFLKTYIIGEISLNEKRFGCKINFNFENENLQLDSDSTLIESTKIKQTDFYYTEIDFELNEEEATKIKNNKATQIQYNFKKNTVTLLPVEANIEVL